MGLVGKGGSEMYSLMFMQVPTKIELQECVCVCLCDRLCVFFFKNSV